MDISDDELERTIAWAEARMQPPTQLADGRWVCAALWHPGDVDEDDDEDDTPIVQETREDAEWGRVVIVVGGTLCGLGRSEPQVMAAIERLHHEAPHAVSLSLLQLARILEAWLRLHDASKATDEAWAALVKPA